MGLHKLTAGDGYTYMTRQVAMHDAMSKFPSAAQLASWAGWRRAV